MDIARAASLVPFVGPGIGILKVLNAAINLDDQESLAIDLESQALSLKNIATRLSSYVATARTDIDDLRESARKVEERREGLAVEIRNCSQACKVLSENARDHALYVIGGSLLTLATVVGLVAMDILSAGMGVCLGVVYGIMSLAFGYAYHTYSAMQFEYQQA